MELLPTPVQHPFHAAFHSPALHLSLLSFILHALAQQNSPQAASIHVLQQFSLGRSSSHSTSLRTLKEKETLQGVLLLLHLPSLVTFIAAAWTHAGLKVLGVWAGHTEV